MKTSFKASFNLTLLLLSVVFIFGCATSSSPPPAPMPGFLRQDDPKKISVGMTKEEAIKNLGKPQTVSTNGNSETLTYILERPWWQDKLFRVKIVDGKVESFGVAE
jgi:outer membrane protein assembly factor BamE (lipoprotein component of BamABCDE complex)